MVEGPVARRRFSRRIVRNAILGTVGVVLLAVLGVGGWYGYRAHSKVSAESARKEDQEFASGLAAAVSKPIAAEDSRLTRLAADPQIVALFQQQTDQPGQDALDAAAAQHTADFNSALRLRFLLPGHYGLDEQIKPPLSFASIDMLNRLEKSNEPVAAEVHLAGTPDEHVVMIHAVRDKSGSVVGLIHLSLNVGIIKPVLAGLQLNGGYMELRQPSGGTPVVLGKAGPQPGGGEPVVVSVPDTRWSVAYWAAGGASASSPEGGEGANNVPLFAAAGILLLLLAGGMVWMRRRGEPEDDEDEESGPVNYDGAVKAIMEGAHPGMEKLVPNLPKLGQHTPIKPVSPGATGDDITMMVHRDQLKVSGPDPVPAAKPKAPAPAAKKAGSASPAAAAAPPAPAAQEPASRDIAPEIFRAYDIRGMVGKTLTVESMTLIGKAIGSEAKARQVNALALGRDGRKSSPELAEALAKGILSTGCNVVDVGMVPTPLLYFATHHLEVQGGVMVTGSHNGPAYNGVKIVLAGDTLAEGDIQALYQRIHDGKFESGAGSQKGGEIIADYVRRVSEDIPVALGNAFKIVLDCGNGVAGVVAPQLFQALGHDVVELYCDVDGSFPNHHPDPSQPGNLETLVAWVHETEADLGLAFDGDGDRLGVVDGKGNIIWPDRQLMVLARDVLSRNAGAAIIYDVKCSRHLGAIIEAAGGKPIMWRTGHSLIKRKMKEESAPLAGEMSGHIFFKERWYGFDDALYTAARMLEVFMKDKTKPDAVFAALPQSVSTPELRVPLPESRHGMFMEGLAEKIAFDGARIIDVDGYRVEFPDGWGLVRASNTSPELVLRFEADSNEVLARIQAQFRDAMLAILPDLKLPF